MTEFFTPPGHTLMNQPQETSLKAAGIAVIAMDTGRVLMQQRALNHILCPNCDTPVEFGMDEGDWWSHADGSINCWNDSDMTAADACGEEPDPNEGTWEFPGGKLDPGENPKDAAVREFQEEIGTPLPSGLFVSEWNSPEGEEPVYRGFVYLIQSEDLVDLTQREIVNPDDPDGDRTEQAAWWDIEHAKENPALREEVKGIPWDELEIWADKSVRSSREVVAMFRLSTTNDYWKIAEDGWSPYEDPAFGRELPGEDHPPTWVREVQNPSLKVTHHILTEGHRNEDGPGTGWVLRVGSLNPTTGEFDYDVDHPANSLGDFYSLDEALAHSRVLESDIKEPTTFSVPRRQQRERDVTRPQGGSPPNKRANLDPDFDWIYSG